MRQITLGHGLQFVHQPQNGGLVGIVDPLGVLLLTTRFKLLLFSHVLTLAAVQQLHPCNTHSKYQTE